MPRAWTLAAFLVATLMMAPLLPVEAASLTPETRQLEQALVGASAVHHDGTVYVFGGRLETGAYSDEVLALGADGSAPRVVARIPAAEGAVSGPPGRYSGAAVAAGGRIYYFGGASLVEVDLNGDGQQEKVPRAARDIVEFDPATQSIRTLQDKLPTGAWGMTAVESAGYVYLFGGFTFDPTDLASTKRHDRVVRFQPGAPEGSAQRVKLLQTTLPYAVQDAASAKVGPRVYIMGGLSDHDDNANPCPTYTYYNTQTGREETNQVTVCLTKRMISFDATPNSEFAIGVAGELPYRVQFASAGVVGGKAYLPGGLLTDGTATSSIVEVSADSAGSPTARVITPTLPRGTFGQGVASDGATLLLVGGRTGGDRDLSREISRLDPRATAPWAPRAANATDIPNGVRLTWEPPAYNGDGAITGYRVYRQAVGGEEERLAEVTTLSYDDTTLRPGTQYTWRVTAVNAAGESTTGARVVRSSGIVVPGPVGDLQGFPGNGFVLLRWRAPEETGGSNLTGYRILRNDALLTTLPPGAEEYRDEAATNGETYQYAVRAYNAKGDGALAPSVRVTPAPVPAAPPNVNAEVVAQGAGSAVRLTWFAPAESVERYVVLRATLPGRPGEPIGEATGTEFVDPEVARGRTYYYTVSAVNDVGRSPPSPESAVSLVRKPGAPGDVAALGMEGEVRVSWTAPIDTGDAPASSLRYYVSRGGGGASRTIIIKTDIEGTVYVDRAVTPGQTYTYTVTTLNPMPSDPSAAATATPRAIQNRAPTAVLAVLPPFAQAGEPVELDASQSTDIDGAIKDYLFDFGDGTDPVRTTQPTLSHQYASNGTFLATVIVTDNRNEPSQPVSAQVTIGEVLGETPDSGFPGMGGGNGGGPVAPPGSDTPEMPGPGAFALLAAAALLALARRRRHRGE